MKSNYRWIKLSILPCLVLTFMILYISSCKKDYTVVQAPESFNHQVSFNYEYDISGLNGTIHYDSLTADIVIYMSDHLSITWDQMKAEFRKADAAFRAAGVQLRLKKVVNVTFPDEWNNQVAWSIPSLPDSGQNVGFYHKYFYTKSKISNVIQTAFTDFIYDEPNKNKTIFILPMSGIQILFSEQKSDATWEVGGPVATGALSFPGYILHDGIPNDLRGCITMESTTGRTLAHELGHKLINVSHEGLNVSPAFSGTSIPGLLGYGNSVEIYDGQSGRWHKERLLLSPYLYKTVNGEKKYNADYSGVGAYDDAIYGSYVMPQ